MHDLGHRGPDSSGFWSSDKVDVFLGHRRLAVVDLTDCGAQPMKSGDGRWIITYNGEFYNHKDIRLELESQKGSASWEGSSDSETLVEAVAHWGFEGALRRVRGMFAIGAWDSERRELFLARDRLGEKPLYVGRTEQGVIFSSELRTFLSNPAGKAEIDPQSLAEYFRLGYVAHPRSILKNVAKVPPGSFLSVGYDGFELSDPAPYWTMPEQGKTPNADENTIEGQEVVEHLLGSAVREQLSADVPVGAFLSGGVDSSLIVALMQKESRDQVRTFSIGFSDEDFNEAPFARQVAAHLGTQHVEHYVSESEVEALVPRLSEIYDEPFADISQIPTTLVSQIAREFVTVVLTGDGADELFFGYGRYQLAHQLGKAMDSLPGAFGSKVLAPLFQTSAGVLERLGQGGPDALLHTVSRRFRRLSTSLLSQDFSQTYRGLVAYADVSQGLVSDYVDLALWPWTRSPSEFRSDFEFMRFVDLQTYLPGDILTKVDRATMSVGLEARVPFLDQRLVEFMLNNPKFEPKRDQRSKEPLRSILDKYVPSHLTDRKKMGFGVPIDDWLRGPLRPWASELVFEGPSGADEFVDKGSLKLIWQRHLDRETNSGQLLWTVLTFLAWYRKWFQNG
jgi:asparagine synthase (glutamine-hydrolysing)